MLVVCPAPLIPLPSLAPLLVPPPPHYVRSCSHTWPHNHALSGARGGELDGIARLLANVCSYPAINVVAATLPFWGACVERQRNLPPAPHRVSSPANGLEAGEAPSAPMLLQEGIQAQMLVSVMGCLGQGGMSPLDEVSLLSTHAPPILMNGG